jgi:1,2-dihydroxy-3-keto-5-methylthiopentene dioxygenase
MATVTLHRHRTVLDEPAVVSAYLEAQGIPYASWGVRQLKGRMKNATFSPEDQQAILSLYEPELTELKARWGYRSQDLVVLSDRTPNLEGILAPFRREHHHTDDEVRCVVDGSGLFTVCRGRLVFDVTVRPGDLIMIPAFTRHWFSLTPERKITCIRVFKDPAGWAAIYDEPNSSV